MTERRTVRARYERLGRELVTFGAVGAAGFLVNVAVFNVCMHLLDLAPVRSGVLATGTAIAVTYVGNRYWTYPHCDKSRLRREAFLFLLFSGVGMVIENGMLAISHYGLDFTSSLADNLAKYVLGLGLGSCFRFWSYRTWVFRSVDADASVAPRPAPAAATAPAGPVGPPPLVEERAVSAGWLRLAAQEESEDRRSLLK